jgi:hypothetical protein
MTDDHIILRPIRPVDCTYRSGVFLDGIPAFALIAQYLLVNLDLN